MNGETLVQQPFLEQLFQQPPHRFDVFIVEGDVRVVEVEPVAHLHCEVVPQVFVLHHLLAAEVVEFFNADLCADVFLGDAEGLFHADLHGKAVGIPARLAFHMVPFEGFVTAEYILDGARHYMMDARFPVGRGRPFVEDEFFVVLSGLQALVEGVVVLPVLVDLIPDGDQVELAIFFVLPLHAIADCGFSLKNWVQK